MHKEMKSFAKGYLGEKDFKPFNGAATSAQNHSSEQPSHLYMALQLLNGEAEIVLGLGTPKKCALVCIH